MNIKPFLIAGALYALCAVDASAKGPPSLAKHVDDVRAKFFMPVSTNSLCPSKFHVSAEKLDAHRSSALTYLDFLQASAGPGEQMQVAKARAEISAGNIPPSFLAESTKIYRRYTPAQAESLFCTRLNRMFDANIAIMGMLLRDEQKRRGGVRAGQHPAS
jgi:hypothetical protein